MEKTVKIIKNSYYDSVTLMLLSSQLLEVEGVEQAIVSMATPMNKELLVNVGMSTPETQEAGGNDLIIAVSASDKEVCEVAVQKAMELMRRKAAPVKTGEIEYTSTAAVVADDPDMQLAVVSTAGRFAALEAMQALKSGLNVMVFSDNVTLDEEIRLKQYAHQKGLLVMGPDCGTAIIGGVGLCFANKVAKGDIGLVAAAGTGLQEVSTLIDRFGGGISQAIGVGGRDLSVEVGGIMLLDSLKMLSEDDGTKVIVIISKPPHPKVRETVLDYAKGIKKPVIVCFVASSGERDGHLIFAGSLEEAARLAVIQAGGTAKDSAFDDEAVRESASRLGANQKYIRALYCGGTLAAEAEYIMQKTLHGVYSNVSKKPESKIKNPLQSEKHTIIDLGDDLFTEGRAHPMIDPTVRLGRIRQEAEDEATAVLLMDFELGYGSHADPVGATAEAIRFAQQTARSQGRELIIVGYVLGTGGDEQGLDAQTKTLRDLGVLVASSNLQAVEMAVAIVDRRKQA